MKKEKPDWVFVCRKCGHNLYVGKERLKKIFKTDCPSCGEEPEGNWIIVGEGDYEKTPYGIY